MFVRVVFLLLLAANVGVAAWLYLAPQRHAAATVAPVTDPGVPALQLLAENEPARPEASAAELAAAPSTPEEEARDRCVSLGPFGTQADLRRAMNALTPLVKRIQFRESRQNATRGFLVYLPAPSSREQSLAVARSLSAKGVRDYYVVTAGEQQNSISLGLFKDRNNAERRRAEVAALGFAPAIVERNEEAPVYWLDYALSPDAKLNWREKLGNPSDVSEQTASCFP